jgi:hypothetical protein
MERTRRNLDLSNASAARRARLAWLGPLGVVLPLVGMAIYFGLLFVRGKYQDWFHLYHGIQAVAHGHNPYEAGIRCYLYPPAFAMAFVPLG